MPLQVPEKMIKMLHNLIAEQNRQLLRIIALNEDLDYNELLTRYVATSQIIIPHPLPLPLPTAK